MSAVLSPQVSVKIFGLAHHGLESRRNGDANCATMLRVGNLDRSLAFYRSAGDEALAAEDYPDGRFTLAFVGYGEEFAHGSGTYAQLGHEESYDLGKGYGHIAIEVEVRTGTCEEVKARGGKVTREADR